MSARTVLCNDCEPWILKNREFLKKGKEFMVLPCAHKWRRKGGKEFVNLETAIVWRVVVRNKYPSLEPKGASSPTTRRCCSDNLLSYGPRIPIKELPLEFECPVCDTPWRITDGVGPELVKVRMYTNTRTGKTFRRRGAADEAMSPFLEQIAQHTPVT